LYVARSFGPFGVVATVQGPGVPQRTRADQGELGSSVPPQMLQLYTGLFHDRGPALEGYIDVLSRALWHRVVVAVITLAAGSTTNSPLLQLVLGAAVPGSTS
jgi:hypothetical protein